MQTLTRRRFLAVTSAACLMSQAKAAQAYRWRGVALGAQATILLDHPDAEALTARAVAEIDRLENVFSLYRAQSSLSRLNAEGVLAAPDFELLECLSLAGRVHDATGGAFDPSVQPLWAAHAEARAQGVAPEAGALERAAATVGWHRMTFDTDAIRLAPGQALTLNGIAQGYIADKVADLFRAAGVKDVLVDTGEIVALGDANGQAGWPVSIQGTGEALRLTGRALATSAVLGTVLDPEGAVGHILDPRTGQPATGVWAQVSVSAERAAVADALSTGLVVMASADAARAAAAALPGARIESLIARA